MGTSGFRSRLAAGALAGTALAASGGGLAQAQPQDSPPPPPPEHRPQPPRPPRPSPQPAPLATSVDLATVAFTDEDLRETRPQTRLLMLGREHALSYAVGDAETTSGCPTRMRRLGHRNGMETHVTLYDDLSVQASEARGEGVCVYFVDSYAPPPPGFLGRRHVGEEGPRRARLVARRDWSAG